MMQRSQFALAVGADPKWVDNARRQLGRATRNTPKEARWLGIVHELHAGLKCSLTEAAAYADKALAGSGTEQCVRLAVGESQRVEIVFDARRDLTIHLARLSLALERPPVERRGRPALKPRRDRVRERAAAYGVDISRLEDGRHRTVEERLARLDENVAFIRAARASRVKSKGQR